MAQPASTQVPLQAAPNGGGLRHGGCLAWGADVPALLRDPNTGQVCLNDDKNLVTWRWIPTTFNSGGFPVTVPANGGVRECDVQIGGGSGSRGDTEVGSFILTATGPGPRRIAIKPYVSSPVDRNLSNIPIPATLISGTAQLPGLLPSSIYCLAKSFWRMTLVNNGSSDSNVSLVLFGRQFSDHGREKWADQRRLSELLQVAWPYWIGPVQAATPNASTGAGNLTGPEISLAPGATVTLRFPVPSFADYLLKWILDDSTSTTGSEPLLTAKISEEDTNRSLQDSPTMTDVSGIPKDSISWRDFLACPTIPVSGFPGNLIRAFSLGAPRGCWTHLVKRTSAIVVTFTSFDSGTITLRPALLGWLLNAKEPSDRHYSNTMAAHDERVEQNRAAGNDPVRLFGARGN